MCIFSRPVISVNNTQIFARLSGKGTQFLAYQMNYESSEQNAMILPVPVKKARDGESLRFINLEGYRNFFTDLAKGFPYRSQSGIGCSKAVSESKTALQVFKVGNYDASFVPSVADFDRLDPRFQLPEETWQRVPEYKNFGFAVFQLAAGAVKPHPMAFEFHSAIEDVFFPTIHIHDGKIHESEEFDHVLYVQHAGLDSKVYGYKNADVEDPYTRLIRSKNVASRFCKIPQTQGLVVGNLLMHRKIMKGNLLNNDTIFQFTGDPLKPAFSFRSYLSYAYWLTAIGAIGWFFARRSKIRKSRLETARAASEDEIGATAATHQTTGNTQDS